MAILALKAEHKVLSGSFVEKLASIAAFEGWDGEARF